MKSRLEEAILGSSNARMEMMRRRQNSSASLAGNQGELTLIRNNGWSFNELFWKVIEEYLSYQVS